ncbi:conserved membrane hypothetical protein [Burkholderiales bacterium 8X]|nr:conserved membrane hypothetical protein [Burkholderiales bacterium 8X]
MAENHPGKHHRWQFFRAGGVDQVVLRSGADIANIRSLDQKLWVALACPTRGIEFDTRTLDLIDTDDDQRIRPPELIAACEWACAQVRDTELLTRGGDSLMLSDFVREPPAPPEATVPPTLADEARRVLQLAGKEDADTITLADVLQRSEQVAAMRFNGDGVITPATAEDDQAARKTIERIAATHGTLKDSSGLDGIDRKRAEAFFGQLEALRDWQVGDGSRQCNGELLAATEAVNAVQAKVDDFFTRCRIAAYDIQSVPALNASIETYQALGAQQLALQSAPLAELPLAPVAPGRSLPLCEGVNPAWADALRLLRSKAVAPLLGACVDMLAESGWAELQQRVAPCQAWLAAKPVSPLSEASPEEVDELLKAREAVMALVDEDERTASHNARLLELEKLLRFKRDLLQLLENFVSFKAFYKREGAIFQAGTLYLDSRSCDLTVQVDDIKQHATLAGLAKTCLAYCECRREGKKLGIVAAFTAGDTDFLFVGRNGVFYDRQGRDWDATIVRLIDNPTSVSQAFFSPYKKFVRMIEEQVARRAAASEAHAQGALGSLATTLTTADQQLAVPGAAGTPKPVAQNLKLPGSRIDVGTVAAIGVAMGSISAVLVAVFSKFIDLGQWIPIALVGIVLAISGPSMLIAWLKLRQRSLGPILDASGWAINGRMKVNVRLGSSLSKTAHVPPQDLRPVADPFADRSRAALWSLGLLLVVIAAVIAWQLGWLDSRLPIGLQRTP